MLRDRLRLWRLGRQRLSEPLPIYDFAAARQLLDLPPPPPTVLGPPTTYEPIINRQVIECVLAGVSAEALVNVLLERATDDEGVSLTEHCLLQRVLNQALMLLHTIDRQCHTCGCTQNRACDGGCSWVDVDLCSTCSPLTKVAAAMAEAAQTLNALGDDLEQTLAAADRAAT